MKLISLDIYFSAHHSDVFHFGGIRKISEEIRKRTEYWKSEKVTKFRKIFYFSFFSVVIAYGIIKLKKIVIILNLGLTISFIRIIQ